MLPLKNTPEAGVYLSLDPGHLANLRSRGLGPAYVRLGRAVRYRTEDLDQWVQSQRVDGADL